MKKLYIRWQDINWTKIQSNVLEWQRQIYLASKNGEIKTVRKYQHRVIGSMDSKLLAVRRVTQDNKGKKTAGIDKVRNIPPEQRLTLAHTLSIPTKASPLRRVWIPKPGETEQRPIGIPTIKDRCLQALFKLALEPEWEAKFEKNSYGFRPGKNCHDAISAVRSFIQKRDKYVLDADIAKCFDRINHNYLLNKIGMVGKYRQQLKYWLKSGVLNGNTFTQTNLGTPQGGVISPLLANIALHGIETFCKNAIKEIPMIGQTGKPIRPSRRIDTLGFVRYADDFVIIHPDLEVIKLLQKKLPEFLTPIGLELKNTKTRISHTLEIKADTIEDCPGFNGGPGFNFLGFFIRQHKTFHGSAYGPNSQRLGFRTLIIPSKEKRIQHQKVLHKIILKDGKSLSQQVLIKKLNPVIRGWANYFGKSDANTCGLLGQMDYLLYLKLRQWAKRVFKTSGKGKSAFRKIGSNKWTFATKEAIMVNHIDYSFPLSKYKKVKAEASPYDGNHIYWTNRIQINNFLFNTRVTSLLKAQKGKCQKCNTQFTYEDILEVDHIIPKSKGGKDVYTNLQLLHRHCHDTKTRTDITTKNSIDTCSIY